GMIIDVLSNSASLDFFDLFERFQIDSLLVVNIAIRVRTRNHMSTQLVNFFNRIDGYISGTGNYAGFAFEGVSIRSQHLFGEKNDAISSGFLSHLRPAIIQAFPSNHARLVTIR